jgi:hypothetical protein
MKLIDLRRGKRGKCIICGKKKTPYNENYIKTPCKKCNKLKGV